MKLNEKSHIKGHARGLAGKLCLLCSQWQVAGGGGCEGKQRPLRLRLDAALAVGAVRWSSQEGRGGQGRGGLVVQLIPS